MILDFTLQSFDVFFCDKISGEGEITLLRPRQDSSKLSRRLTLTLSDKSVVAYVVVANLLLEVADVGDVEDMAGGVGLLGVVEGNGEESWAGGNKG
ncbi:hypothetical protein Droror1_Dr00006158 [Drosera rotundifolia]